MIYLYSGDKYKEVKRAGDELVKKLVSEKPDSSIIQINEDNFREHDLLNLSKEQGLFEKKLILVLSHAISGFWEEIEEKLKSLADSGNVFIFIEDSLDKRIETKISKIAKESKNFSSFQKEKYNPFLLTDALGNKDKKKLWALFQTALINNSSAEEIQGLLFWQIKSILIAKLSVSPTESGLKPFVFSKSKKFGENFTENELKKHSNDLVRIYHEARRGIGELSTNLEKFILKI